MLLTHVLNCCGNIGLNLVRISVLILRLDFVNYLKESLFSGGITGTYLYRCNNGNRRIRSLDDPRSTRPLHLVDHLIESRGVI